MNAFKTGFINSRCCNHFPSHTVVTVSLAANCTRAGSQLALHPLQQRSVARGAPPHVSVPPNLAVYRWHTLPRRAPVRPLCYPAFRTLFRPRLRQQMSDEICQPRRAHDPPFFRLRVLALGYGALWPSCRSKPGVVPYSARLTAPDTQVASAAANGGYWPFAAHFSAGHGATLCSTLRA